MRLDARTKHYPNTIVWHAELCRKLTLVIWVDDETNQWCQHIGTTSQGQFDTEIHQAKKIVISQDKTLVIINPVDDAESDQSATEATEAIAAPIKRPTQTPIPEMQ